jgi:hypothetical protein
MMIIIIGPVADKTAATPDVTYCSAQYNVANVPKVKPTPVKKISFRKNNLIVVFFRQIIKLNSNSPAIKKRNPADKNGGTPASTPIFIAKNVVPKIKHIIM